jgi:hypothetical protein
VLPRREQLSLGLGADDDRSGLSGRVDWGGFYRGEDGEVGERGFRRDIRGVGVNLDK